MGSASVLVPCGPNHRIEHGRRRGRVELLADVARKWKDPQLDCRFGEHAEADLKLRSNSAHQCKTRVAHLTVFQAGDRSPGNPDAIGKLELAQAVAKLSK